MKTYEIMREGEATKDGRFVVPNAITWRDEPLPVLELPWLPDLSEDNYRDAIVVGSMFNLRREGNLIFCDCDVKGEAIGVDLDRMEFNTQDENEKLVITRGRIMGGMMIPKHGYAWRVDED